MDGKLTSTDVVGNQDDYRIALELRRLVEDGDLAQQQANTVLNPTQYRLEETTRYEIEKREMGSANE